MGFIKRAIIKEAVKIGAATAISKIPEDSIIYRNDKDNLMKKDPENIHLLLRHPNVGRKDTLVVYDDYGNKKYSVKKELLSYPTQLRLFDIRGNLLGMVQEKFFSDRFDSILRSPKDFRVYIGNQMVGEIYSEIRQFKRFYKFSFPNWTFNGDFLGMNFDAYNSGEWVFKISHTTTRTPSLDFYGNLREGYVLNISTAAYEPTALMMTLAIYAAQYVDDNRHTK